MAVSVSVLAARQVSKAFFGNPALRAVSIALLPGRVHALVGENGAGKSTLINILAGVLVPDSGRIELDGRPAGRLTPSGAHDAGIAVVHQELSLTSSLSIAENVGAGSYPRCLGLVDYRRLHRDVAAVCRLVGLEEDLSRPVAELPLGRRQLVEIAKALFRQPKVLILDEPTSSLSAGEARTLADLVARLKADGLAILYISHRLGEIMTLCEHVTVLKDGQCTADRPLAGVTPEALVRLMVGRDLGDLFPPREPCPGDTTLLRVHGLDAGLIRGADLEIRAGEVLGIGGLVGQGQEDLLLGLYGAVRGRALAAEVGGRQGLPRSPGDANRRGLAYVAVDRQHEGLLQGHPVAFNLLLPTLAHGRALRRRRFGRERALAADLAASFGIKGSLARAARTLSGGNQQKVALAKWLAEDPSVLLLNDPTRGVDVETKREIYQTLRRLAGTGKAVVLASSDTPELVNLCNRVLVVAGGRVVATLAGDAITEATIVGAAMGAGEAARVA